MHDPYENWEQSLLIAGKFDRENYTSDDLLLQLSDYYNIEGLKHSKEADQLNPFVLGIGQQDIQFLIQTKDSSDILISDVELVQNFPGLSGIDLISISDASEMEIIDQRFAEGKPSAILAETGEHFRSYNLLLCEDASSKAENIALRSGKNLLLFDDKASKDSSTNEAVIRNIEWKNESISLDLSKEGRIRILGRQLEIDTLCQTLKVRLPGIDYFRFEVEFSDAGKHYLSNPYYRYGAMQAPVKAKNQLTIFTNLSWLIAIVLLNLLMNKLRRTYFTSPPST